MTPFLPLDQADPSGYLIRKEATAQEDNTNSCAAEALQPRLHWAWCSAVDTCRGTQVTICGSNSCNTWYILAES